MNSNKDILGPEFDRNALLIDAPKETEEAVTSLRHAVHRRLHRQGAVVGISGGIDSSVVLALCAKAFGPERVVGVMMPERESSPESLLWARKVAEQFRTGTITEDITAVLESYGCYRLRDEAIARLFPQYGPGWKNKISIWGDLINQNTLNVFHLTVVSPDGEAFMQRLPLREYREIVAASNVKQRARMTILYRAAELHNYAVIGTANRNEHALGFFVKHGDGGVDIQPIASLFKTQVFQLARFLDVPEEICARTPTTDTYSAGSSQQDFFFRIPFDILDLVWLGYEKGIPSGELGRVLQLTAEQVDHVIADLVRKQRATTYLRLAPIAFPYFGSKEHA
jgi:NAD+ synthase